MGTNREHMSCHSFGIARYEIKRLVDTRRMCCYADFGDGEVVEEFDGERT